MPVQADAAPPVVHVVIADELEEQHVVSQLPLVHVTSPLQLTPLLFLA